MKELFKIILAIFIFDFFISTLLLKKTDIWKHKNWDNKYWRILSKIYHHDFKANINVLENWGGNFEKRIITNSLGFRDSEKRLIEKKTHKKRILLVGDSFIEGAGYDYEHTLAGLLQNKIGDKFDILNSAVGSYSPSIYYKKIEYYISKGYHFDHAIVFLDVSDIFDELFIKFDQEENIIIENKANSKKNIKQRFYDFGKFLRNNTVTFRFLYIISDKTEIYKNYLKDKFHSSKFLNKSFFKTSKDDAMFYRMLHVDRGYWTYNDEKFNQVRPGLNQSEKYLKKLFELFNKHSIKSNLVIYPWPTQIYFGDNKHNNFWIKFSKDNKINLINLYDKFKNDNARKSIFDNFINGDIHWNKKGTKLVFNEIIKIFESN